MVRDTLRACVAVGLDPADNIMDPTTPVDLETLNLSMLSDWSVLQGSTLTWVCGMEQNEFSYTSGCGE